MTDKQVQAYLATLDADVRSLVEQALRDPQSPVYQQIMKTVFREFPVPMDEFLFGPKHLSLPSGVLFPTIVDLLMEIDKPGIREVFICAGKGSGKSTLTSCIMAREAYKVQCYQDAAAFFGLMPGSMIAIVNMSISSDQAKMVIFNKFWNLITHAPCFLDAKGDPNFRKKERSIEFPGNTFALSGHSDYKAYFGYDVICGVLDEWSWFRDKADRPVAEEIYQGILGSAKTRFPGHYKILAISSPQAADDALFKRVSEGKRLGKRVMLGVDGDADGQVMDAG